MNIVTTTANKVLELEKRLDNQLTDKSIRVSEVNKTIENTIFGEVDYKILTFDAKKELSVVVQGEVDISVEGETEFQMTLILDGFEIYSKSLMLSGGEHSLSVMKAMNIMPNSTQDLILKVKFTGISEVYVKGYSFFVWGYGESLELGVSSSEPKLSATEENGRYAICFALDGRAFVHFCTGFPEKLNFNDFSYLGEFVYVEPIYQKVETSENDVEGDESTEIALPNLLMFAISTDGLLYQFSGERVGTSLSDGVKIDENVISVTATKVKAKDEIVVVYAKSSGEINYFSVVDGARSEVMTLVKFEEKVGEVSLIHNCETTTFLVVGLESGRSYLYSSVTAVAWSDKLSHISMSMGVSFT